MEHPHGWFHTVLTSLSVELNILRCSAQTLWLIWIWMTWYQQWTFSMHFFLCSCGGSSQDTWPLEFISGWAAVIILIWNGLSWRGLWRESHLQGSHVTGGHTRDIKKGLNLNPKSNCFIMRQVYVKHTCKKLEWIDFTFHSLELFNAPRDVMPRGLNTMLKDQNVGWCEKHKEKYK